MSELFAGRYRLESRLGVGGMSTVQLAFDTRLERYVAVKLLAEHLAADAGFVARFRREALAAARLTHPNVVQVYDFGTDEASGRQFIVMEHVDGHSCSEILRDRGHLDPDEAVEILGQACRGLEYAHRNGVVHRDVKPGNLLINRDNAVKLADFGIAKAAEDSDITKVGSVLGTAAYLAPEQAKGEAAGPASDLYALGVVAYQLLTGRLPYQGSSLTELARQQQSGPPTDLHHVEPAVPAALSAAVMRALERDPGYRYTDALEMEAALRDGLRGRAPAPVEEPTYRMADDTEATRSLGPATAATRAAQLDELPPPRRQLQPLPEHAAPPRRAARPVAAGPAHAPGPRRRGGSLRWLRRVVVLLVLFALALGGIYAYDAVQSQTANAVELKEDIQGGVSEAVDEIQQLIDDNVRSR